MAPPQADDDNVSKGEQDSLLSNNTHFASTYDGIRVQHDDEEQRHGDDHTEAPSVFTNIAETVSEVVHDGIEVVTEVAGEVQHAVVEVVEAVEHVVVDIGEELQTTFVEILAPEPEEELPAEDEGKKIRWNLDKGF